MLRWPWKDQLRIFPRLNSVSGCLCLDSPTQYLPTDHKMTRVKAPKSTASESSIALSVNAMWKSYMQNTSDRLKLIDAFLVFIMLSGVIQFVYCVFVTNFPFNAFLAG